MKLSIIIPVYNEKQTISKIVEIIKKIDIGNIKKEIIIVEDFSNDGTREILKEIGKANKNIKIVYHKENLGKGSAIRTGIKEVTGDIVLIQDADLEYKPEDYKKLIYPIINNETKVVYGSRFLKKRKKRGKICYFIANKFLTFVTRFLYRIKITDMETCYKVFRSDVIKNIELKSKRFDFEAEITAKIAKKKYKIKEVPISYYARTKVEGKKIGWKDGIETLWALIKYRFSN